MVKQLKNRYNDPTTNKRFVIGVDRAKMKLYDLEQSAQKGITDSGIKHERQERPAPRPAPDPAFDGIFSNKRDFSKIRI
jgi:hypothetical protein